MGVTKYISWVFAISWFCISTCLSAHMAKTSTIWNYNSFGEDETTAEKLRIVGGEVAKRHEFPHLVSIQSVTGIHFCGGAIINPDWILTAGHCVEKENQGSLRIVAGAHRLSLLNRSRQHRRSKSIILHPKYNISGGWAENDVALIQVDFPFNMSTTAVKCGQVAPKDFVPKMSTTAVVAGWGDTRENGTISDILLKINVPLLTTERCKELYAGRPDADILPNMLCAGAIVGKSFCNGDSGGPLLCEAPSDTNENYIICGIVSWSEGCGQEGLPDVYAKVSYFAEWIKRTMTLQNILSKGY